MARYHINPETMYPTVCNAKKGKCPYQNVYSHFDSFAEADAFATKEMEKRYMRWEKPEEAPKQESIYEEKGANEVEYIKELNERYTDIKNKDFASQIKELAVTNDKELMDAILQNRIIFSNNRQETYMRAVIRNPNLPLSWRNRIEEYPTSSNIVLSVDYFQYRHIPFEQLEEIATEQDDIRLVRGAMSNSFIRSTQIVNIFGEDGHKPVDNPRLLFLYFNPNIPESIKETVGFRLNKYGAGFDYNEI